MEPTKEEFISDLNSAGGAILDEIGKIESKYGAKATIVLCQGLTKTLAKILEDFQLITEKQKEKGKIIV